MTGKKFVYDWAKEPHTSFLGWFLPTVMVDVDSDQQADLAKRTRRWTDVQVQVLINGVEVDARNFLDSVERNIEHCARNAARDMLNNVIRLDDLEDRVTQIRVALIEQVEAALREQGIELPDDED